MEGDKNCNCQKSDNMNMIENYVESVNDKCKDDTRRELINKIKCYQFAVVELALYLDTHPEDEKALCLHKKYCKELKDAELRLLLPLPHPLNLPFLRSHTAFGAFGAFLECFLCFPYYC